MLPSPCPECGAILTAGESCRVRFNQFLALELTDPAYGMVHHLTVPAYYLQHPSLLSAKGWKEMRHLLGRFLIGNASAAEVRADSRLAMASDRRDWSVTKGLSLRLPDGFTWRATILGVDSADPVAYPAAITAWARQVLEDSADISIGPSD